MSTIPAFEFTYSRNSVGIQLTEPLTVPATGLIWLTGASGSGKSTFLNLLKGLHPEFIHGTLRGGNPAIAPHALYLSQNPHTQLVRERVGEEFFFSLEHRQDAPEQMAAQKHMLERFGLGDFEFAATHSLSHGQAQRLLLASMLATQPSILLLDEPTAFLDAAMRAEFYQLLNTLKQDACIILIDHHAAVAECADTCWHVDADGRIEAMSVAQYQAHTHSELIQAQSVTQVLNLPIPPPIRLELNDLTIGYSRKAPLFSASAQLNSGECAVLCGANGSGKSTLLNTLAGLTKPISGQLKLWVNGEPAKPRTQMMYVFQHPDSHFFFDTVAQELTQLGIQDIDATLAQFGLMGCAERSPQQRSEGQKRRLTQLLPIFFGRPRIVLDEPTFGQDALNTMRITQLIQAFKSAGYALIVITHDAQLQAHIADQIWQIDQGQLRILKHSSDDKTGQTS